MSALGQIGDPRAVGPLVAALRSDVESVRSAATAAVWLTAEEICLGSNEKTEDIALVISHVFSEPIQFAPVAQHETVIEALQEGIAGQLAVLDNVSLTGTGQSSADVIGVAGEIITEKLSGHLLREIVIRGANVLNVFTLMWMPDTDIVVRGKRIAWVGPTGP